MHRTSALAITLLFTAASLAGCTTAPPDNEGGTGNAEAQSDEDASDPRANRDDSTGSDDTTAGTTGDEATGRDDGEGDAGDSDSADVPARNDDIAPPGERHEETAADVDRPGEYAFLDQTPGADSTKTLAVPTWTSGDTWTYEIWHWGQDLVPGCGGPTAQRPGFLFTMSREANIGGIPVYQLDEEGFDCAHETSRTSQRYMSQANLNPVESDGYEDHRYLFPLQDGKRWHYMDDRSRSHETTVTYVPDYEHDGATVEAWQVHIVDLQSDDNTTTTYWFGTDAKNTLRREIRTDLCTTYDDETGACTERQKDELVFLSELVEAGTG